MIAFAKVSTGNITCMATSSSPALGTWPALSLVREYAGEDLNPDVIVALSRDASALKEHIAGVMPQIASGWDYLSVGCSRPFMYKHAFFFFKAEKDDYDRWIDDILNALIVHKEVVINDPFYTSWSQSIYTGDHSPIVDGDVLHFMGQLAPLADAGILHVISEPPTEIARLTALKAVIGQFLYGDPDPVLAWEYRTVEVLSRRIAAVVAHSERVTISAGDGHLLQQLEGAISATLGVQAIQSPPDELRQRIRVPRPDEIRVRDIVKLRQDGQWSTWHDALDSCAGACRSAIGNDASTEALSAFVKETLRDAQMRLAREKPSSFGDFILDTLVGISTAPAIWWATADDALSIADVAAIPLAEATRRAIDAFLGAHRWHESALRRHMELFTA